jgi:hypothetical protein
LPAHNGLASKHADHDLEVYLNLAGPMKLTGVNQLWVADITYIRLHREWVFLAVILDGFFRKVVGWELDRTLAARLPLAALEKAIAERKPPPGVVHHSDRGVQYASDVYVGLLRLHWALGYKPPEEFEQAAKPARTVKGATMSFFWHEEIFRSDVGSKTEGEPAETSSQPIVSMSLQLAIPQRVGLHQNPPPLRQLGPIVAEKGLIEQTKPVDGKCANSVLSQWRGSPHFAVPYSVPTPC